MSGVGGKPRAFEAKPGSAKVFSHGGSQAVRLPTAFRLGGDRVNVRREAAPTFGPASMRSRWMACYALSRMRRREVIPPPG